MRSPRLLLPPANATCAIVGATAARSVWWISHTRGAGSVRDAGGSGARRAFSASSCRAANSSIICVSFAYSIDACVSASSALVGSGSAAGRSGSASAAIIAAMTGSDTPALFSATRARGDRSKSTAFAPMAAMIVESLNCASTIA